MQEKKQILLVAQIDDQMETPHTGDLYKIGTLAALGPLKQLGPKYSTP